MVSDFQSRLLNEQGFSEYQLNEVTTAGISLGDLYNWVTRYKDKGRELVLEIIADYKAGNLSGAKIITTLLRYHKKYSADLVELITEVLEKLGISESKDPGISG